MQLLKEEPFYLLVRELIWGVKFKSEKIPIGRKKEKGVDVADLFEKAHALLMKPVISDKDNEEKQIVLLERYVSKGIIKKIPVEFEKQYRFYCGEAYNKVTEYLKYSFAFRSGKDYIKLKEKLKKASLPKV